MLCVSHGLDSICLMFAFILCFALNVVFGLRIVKVIVCVLLWMLFG
ncbi:hypothetical protein Patl1_07945 [Pistacia atlantica]|uniref:Uncharacterized protein n=1 Tax=Pistacia atlantica TaxID=434234 RepID=A0ACC1AEY9_9ROSI|nr:hypothetical protein Patl1_07945 [Pistacia atlantica]